MLALLFIALLIPMGPDVAGLRMDLQRVYLLIFTLPFLLQLVSGRRGPLLVSDLLVFMFGAWVVVTIVHHDGTAKFAYSVISAVEYVGGYLAGRVLIRSGGDYRRFIRYYLVAMLCVLPLALIEFKTGRIIAVDVLGSLATVARPDEQVMRLGFFRVQAVFPHPILYGVFSSLIFANVYYLYRGRLARLFPRLAIVVGSTYMSLSSAPFLSVGVQVMLIAWDKIMRGRWYLLLGLSSAIFIFLELASNRGPFILIIDTLTLNPATAWWRVHIFNYGMENVWDNPFLGLGLGDWKRPSWLAETIDNFWLLMAMRHGIPGFLMLAIAILLHIINIVRTRIDDPDVIAIRTGYMVGLVGLIFTLATVHVWSAMAVLVFFYLGAGSFLYTGGWSTLPSSAMPGPDGAPESAPGRSRGSLAFSRFDPVNRRR